MALSKWLWQVHDKVNQKISKPYKAYAEVVQRHKTFHALVDERAVLDLFSLIAMNCSDKSVEHAVSFIHATSKATKCIFAPTFSATTDVVDATAHGSASKLREQVAIAVDTWYRSQCITPQYNHGQATS